MSNTKSRGNGTGSVYKKDNGKWMGEKTLGYWLDDNGKSHRRSVRKTFKTKKEAIIWLASDEVNPSVKAVTFRELYDKWIPTHEASDSTMSCYKAAIAYFKPVWFMSMEEITVDDLQECLDDCPKGKRTKQNMKTVCGLIYKFGIPRHFVPGNLNLSAYVTVKADDDGSEKEALPLDAVEKLRNAVGTVPFADYVLCHCYLGFRPAEFLSLDAMNYNRQEKAFVGGAKTEAGKNRTVTVSPKIAPIVDKLVEAKISGPVFCSEDGKQIEIKKYREIFYSVLEECGIDNPVGTYNGVSRHRYTPHSCRHTFATLLKRVDGNDKDKLSMMGHTSTNMLRHYQDVEFSDLRKLTDAL